MLEVLECVRNRAFGEQLRDVSPGEKLLFVPALVMWALDNPRQLHWILAGIEHLSSTSRALAYASLDFSLVVKNATSSDEPEASSRMHTDNSEFEDDETSTSDESLVFENANEKLRAELVIRSLQRHALKSEHEAGSIWNNEACLSELAVLLPIAVSHCSELLSPEVLVKGLVTARCGVNLLVTAAANNPWLAEQIITSLSEFIKAATSRSPKPVSSRTNFLKQSPGLETAAWTLFKLSQISRSFASACREVLVDRMVLEELVLLLTLEVLHDELEFLSGAFFQKQSQWLLSFLSSSQACFLKLEKNIDRDWLVLELRKALLQEARNIKQEKNWCPELQTHLRIFCVLIRTTADLQPSPNEIDFWMKTILHQKMSSSSPSQRLLELGVSFLCLVPGLSTSNTTKALYHRCVAYLFSPVKHTGFSSTTELAIWLAVQLLLRHLGSIAEFIRESLGVHVTVQNTLMRDLAESSATAGITSDPSLLANAVSALRPPGNVKQQSRTLICLEQLLHAGTFGRTSVDISGAIMHAVSQASEPVPLRIVQLIHMYVDAAVHQANTSGLLFKGPELESFLMEAISPAIRCSSSQQQSQKKPSTLATAALATYLILCKEHLLRSVGAGDEQEKPWRDLIACVPWRRFLACMESSSSSYENLLPQWLASATALFPEKFLVQNLVHELGSGLSTLEEDDLQWLGASDEECLAASRIQEASSKALNEPVFILRVLQSMLRRASSHAWDLRDVVGKQDFWAPEATLIRELVPVLLDPRCSPRVQNKFCEWWRVLPDAANEFLTVTFFETVRVSLVYSEFLKEGAPVDYNMLVNDPLLFLSCDPRLFHTPLVSIFLDSLLEIMAVNRRLCESSLVISGLNSFMKREEVAAALVLQESGVCQILLERCLPDRREVEASGLRYAQRAVCGSLSSFFHSNPLLLKLLHFQGYDLRLVPVMVEHLPCMIQCLEFLEELLGQQQQMIQVFAVHLASYVTSRYPEELLSFPVAEKVVSQAVFIQTKIAGSSEFLRQVLQPVSEMAITFPALAPKIVLLIQSSAQAAASLRRSGPPRDEKLHAAALSAFKTLARGKIVLQKCS